MVTGATGLLGSHLLCHLARCGETIIALKRYKSHVEETMALFSCYFDSPGDAISRVTWVVGWGICGPVCGKSGYRLSLCGHGFFQWQ